jgi:hypothetical protein
MDPPGEKIGLGPKIVPVSVGGGVAAWHMALAQKSTSTYESMYFPRFIIRSNKVDYKYSVDHIEVSNCLIPVGAIFPDR